MELNNKTKQILLIIAASMLQSLIMILIFFAEWYMICVENNITLFIFIVILSDFLLNYWYEIRKKVEDMNEK